MNRRAAIRFLFSGALAAAAAAGFVALGQQGPWPPEGPLFPPPVPPPEDADEAPPAASKKQARPAEDAGPPWHIHDAVRARLAEAAAQYREHALRFTCIETVRSASYDGGGEASDEKVRRYAYLLEREQGGETLREYRQAIKADGTAKGGEVRDEEPFPPAFAWVQMFNGFYQSFFAFRDLGERLEGYDWVREIEFRGALPFTDGRDIRQWEGTVLVDADTWTPVEIRAKPGGQDARVRALYSKWAQAFSALGFRFAPKPLLYESRVAFGLRRDGLTFPTELRYDTRMAISATQNVPRKASVRRYDGYRFFKTTTTETAGEPVAP